MQLILESTSWIAVFINLLSYYLLSTKKNPRIQLELSIDNACPLNSVNYIQHLSTKLGILGRRYYIPFNNSTSSLFTLHNTQNL
jgi:hypothetical protein